jgi:hypothetical protein
MPLRLVPVAVVIVFVMLFAIGALDDSGQDRAENNFDWQHAIHGVDSVLDDGLSEDSFGVIHDSVTDTAQGVEGSVDDVVD